LIIEIQPDFCFLCRENAFMEIEPLAQDALKLFQTTVADVWRFVQPWAALLIELVTLAVAQAAGRAAPCAVWSVRAKLPLAAVTAASTTVGNAVGARLFRLAGHGRESPAIW
jgi:hypothetical protein